MLEQLARWLEREYPAAEASLREGLSEMFTINRLGLPLRLRKCLARRTRIDSTHSGVRQKTRRVTNWKNGAMALRWAAATFVENRLEGFRPGGSSLYRRVLVPATGEGARELAWVYAVEAIRIKRRRIVSGSWPE